MSFPLLVITDFVSTKIIADFHQNNVWWSSIPFNFYSWNAWVSHLIDDWINTMWIDSTCFFLLAILIRLNLIIIPPAPLSFLQLLIILSFFFAFFSFLSLFSPSFPSSFSSTKVLSSNGAKLMLQIDYLNIVTVMLRTQKSLSLRITSTMYIECADTIRSTEPRACIIAALIGFH